MIAEFHLGDLVMVLCMPAHCHAVKAYWTLE